MYWGCTAVIDKDMMDLQNYTNVEKDVPGPFGEAYVTFLDGNEATNIKDEVSDAEEEEEEPMAVTFVEIKTEPEVS
jgi:hypothetical protein